MLVEEVHPAQERCGEPAHGVVSFGRLLEARSTVAPRPAREVRLILEEFVLRHDCQQPRAKLRIAHAGVEQHRPDVAVTLHDPVDGMTLGLQFLVEPALYQLPAALQELAVHVDRLVERVAPRLQEAYEREVTP